MISFEPTGWGFLLTAVIGMVVGFVDYAPAVMGNRRMA